MNIKTLRTIGRRYPLSALALLCAAALGGCDVTQPSEAPWSDVRAYSWPVDKVLTYRVDDLANGSKPEEIQLKTHLAHADSVHTNGERFYELKQEGNRAPRLFLPMKDTLVTRNIGFPAELALVAPLVKDHSWICGYSIDGVPWKATILERYSFRKIDGTIYQNVIEVEYRPQSITGNDEIEIFTRFYAEGKGMVQAVESRVSRSWENKMPKPIEQQVLIQTNDAPSS